MILAQTISLKSWWNWEGGKQLFWRLWKTWCWVDEPCFWCDEKMQVKGMWTAFLLCLWLLTCTVHGVACISSTLLDCRSTIYSGSRFPRVLSCLLTMRSPCFLRVILVLPMASLYSDITHKICNQEEGTILTCFSRPSVAKPTVLKAPGALLSLKFTSTP